MVMCPASLSVLGWVYLYCLYGARCDNKGRLSLFVTCELKAVPQDIYAMKSNISARYTNASRREEHTYCLVRAIASMACPSLKRKFEI